MLLCDQFMELHEAELQQWSMCAEPAAHAKSELSLFHFFPHHSVHNVPAKPQWWVTGGKEDIPPTFCDHVMKNNRPGVAGGDGLYSVAREAGEAGRSSYLGRRYQHPSCQMNISSSPNRLFSTC